jgi:predicted nucleotidyltransferase
MVTEEEAIREFAAEVDEALEGRVDRVVVFGSYARGEQLPGSDVDLLIVLEERVEGDQSTVADIAGRYFLEHEMLLAPKLITSDKLEEQKDFSFFKRIREEGVAVYG